MYWYVSKGFRYELVVADTEMEAVRLGTELLGCVNVVRPAQESEIELHRWDQEMREGESRGNVVQSDG